MIVSELWQLLAFISSSVDYCKDIDFFRYGGKKIYDCLLILHLRDGVKRDDGHMPDDVVGSRGKYNSLIINK